MKANIKLLIYQLIYLGFGLLLVRYTHQRGSLFIVWNIFLAFLPLVFAKRLRISVSHEHKNKLLIAVWFALWLLFFPNAPYMVTDLIYFGGTKYITPQGYTTSLLSWAHLIYLAIGVLFGLLLGLFSLYDVHHLLIKTRGKFMAHACLALFCLLSGFAIYLGRMLRFNSWDIARPIHLLVRLRDELSAFSISFSLLFAFYTLGSYLLFYTLMSLCRDQESTA